MLLDTCLSIGHHTIHYRDTALAILSDKNGMEALKRGLNPAPSHLLVKRDKTPLQLLVEEMPGESLPHFEISIYLPA